MKTSTLLYFLLLAGLSIFLTSCKSKTSSIQGQAASSPSLILSSPGACLVSAQLLQILPQEEIDPSRQGCAQGPCMARIKILAVLERGRGFEGEVFKGKELLAHFPYTLSPTQELFPSLQTHFPGLREGENFEAEIVSRMRKGSEQPEFVIHTYKKN